MGSRAHGRLGGPRTRQGETQSNLTWGNCIHETGVLVEDAHGRQIINPHRGTLVPLPGDWIV